MEWGCSWYREAENARNIFVRKPHGKQPLVEERENNEENFKTNFKKIGFDFPMPMKNVSNSIIL
jgi:hypothetical protein